MVDRKELKKKLADVLSECTSYKMLSSEDEVNPCRILFEGVEYIIYIKNLSPAQLSNNNPDVWRIQLPIRDDFETIKKSGSLFVVLGYDEGNDVYTTWNPYWVKQRLNVAKSISLYSRLSLQEKARATGDYERFKLNNEGVVIAFLRSKLAGFLADIGSFFPEKTEYVAIGSRKRVGANFAYRQLCDRNNIKTFAQYLAFADLLEKEAEDCCNAIDHLISDGYFSQNRKIFLACDTLDEYVNKIEEFTVVPEVKELGKKLNINMSNTLNRYIKCLLEEKKAVEKNDESLIEESRNDSGWNGCDASDTDASNEDIDWESKYTDSKGKLTRIANPKLIGLLKPCLDTEYRKLSMAYNVVSSFYGSRYQNVMELKDWNALFNGINWRSPYEKTEHCSVVPPKRMKLKQKDDKTGYEITDKQFRDYFTAAGGWFFLTQYQFIANSQLSRGELLDELFAKGFDADMRGTRTRLYGVQRIIRGGRSREALEKIRDSRMINAKHPEAKTMAEKILASL